MAAKGWGTGMYRFVALIISAALFFAPSDARAQQARASKERTFRMEKRRAADGDVNTVQLRMEMKLDFLLNGPGARPKEMKASDTMVTHYVMTVLAAHKGRLEMVKLAFGETYEDSVEEGKLEREVSPLSGKTYLAARVEGRVVVTDEGGKPISEEERDAIRSHLPDLGKADRVQAALPDKPIRVGDRLDRFAKVFTEEALQSKESSGVRFNNTRVWLSEIVQDPKGDVGIFSLTTTMVFLDGGGPIGMTFPMQGKLRIRGKGARLLEFSLAGPAQVEVNEMLREAGVTAQGSGETRMHMVDPTGT